jgi:lauroyl/myristoyl acyltransferase
MLYRLTLLSQWLARVLPRPLRWWLGGTITQGVYWIWREKRIATQKNMSVVLDLPMTDPRVRRVARLSWRNYGHYVADLFDIPNHPKEYYHALFDRPPFTGKEAIDQVEKALQIGHGVLVITGHYGSWDLAGALVAERITINILAEALPDKKLNELFQTQRQALGINIIMIEESLRVMLRVLREGGTLATPIDRPVTKEEGIPVKFFGRIAYVPRGVGALAVKTGAAILPGFAWYDGSQGVFARAFDPVVIEPTGDTNADIIRATQVMFDALEQMVRYDPTQWYLFRQFWPDESLAEVPERLREGVHVG